MTDRGDGLNRQRSESRAAHPKEETALTSPHASRTGTVTYEGDAATIAFERRLRHPVSVVWDALTDPEHLARWYLTTARLEAHAGGRIDYVSGPSRFHVTGRILAWEPPRVFEHEWNVEPQEFLPQGERSVVRWELTPDGDGTILRITHRKLTRTTANGFVAGTHAFLDRLEEQLDGVPLTNWRTRVDEVRDLYPGWRA